MYAPSFVKAVLSAVNEASFSAIWLKYFLIVSAYFGLVSAAESKQTSTPSCVVSDR
jgi:hypothetical protein